ncbi:DUF3265 domain-containing protein [Vibrio vulnificus]|nr:DUF3265 domain-containing protein [Vibrio vulnificus]EHU9455935.1 DUF3265 domain-containing protein [Vibrio vulnificus]EII3056997.1 DUF3265 domain-containing protein [Vibrio vulnificus]EKG2506435.1 DUF3265 domain-containing protein [Vibrio vulnificus]HDU8768440.1 DUF3265 domain-containing protein [Vibrio vulnificus]
MAFLVCGEFCAESCLRKVGLCGIHPLTRRYVLITKSQLVASFLCFLGFLILVLSANWLSVVAVFWTLIRGREKFRELPH